MFPFMSEPSQSDRNWNELRQQIIGLGETSHRKNYYPALKQSRDALVRFRGVIDEISDMIIIVDSEGTILDLNRTAVDVFEGTRARLVGSGIHQVLGIEKREMEEGLDNLLREDSSESGTVYRELEIRPVRVERRPMWVVIGRDVTHRVEVEEQLKEFNLSLEQKVKDRTADIQHQMKLLTEARDQLVQAEKMVALGNLVAGLAHEINTPLGIGLTASSSQTDEVERLREAIDREELTREMFDDFLTFLDDSSRLIFENLKRAADLVRSFKQVAVDQSSELVRSVNLIEYTNEVIHSLYPQWKRHEVHVIGSMSEPIQTIPGDWSQILTNLVVNSVQHGFRDWKNGGIIRISIAEEDGDILMEYQDNGVGMSAEQVNRVFEPFYTTTRGEGGTGLGMHIVYNLVTLKMSGSIIHFQPDGPGTGFRIRVPMANIEESC